MPIGTFPPIDQKYSQYKTELSPWLSDCPSVILRNSCHNWFETYKKFFKGVCGRPKRKKKGDEGSILLTEEVFSLEKNEYGQWKLFVGGKKNNIGFLEVNFHKKDFNPPKTIRIKKSSGQYFVSFCYDDGQNISEEKNSPLDKARMMFPEELAQGVVGCDRGVKIPLVANGQIFDLTEAEKKNKVKKEKYRKRMQRSLCKKKKGSGRRNRVKAKLTKVSRKLKNIRDNFCHQTSAALVNDKETKVIVFENLKTRNMTKSAKGTIEDPGKNVAAKAGLNRNILDRCWYKLENYTKYKAKKNQKLFFKIDAKYTSQECADCGHIHPDNRKSQSSFICCRCGYSDNADRNASLVIKKRAIKMILDSGTELSKLGVLVNPNVDSGRGGEDLVCPSDRPLTRESSKKKKPQVLESLVLEACAL